MMELTFQAGINIGIAIGITFLLVIIGLFKIMTWEMKQKETKIAHNVMKFIKDQEREREIIKRNRKDKDDRIE